MTGFYFKWIIRDPVIPEGPPLLTLTVRLVSSRQGTANYYDMDAGKSCGSDRYVYSRPFLSAKSLALEARVQFGPVCELSYLSEWPGRAGCDH